MMVRLQRQASRIIFYHFSRLSGCQFSGAAVHHLAHKPCFYDVGAMCVAQVYAYYVLSMALTGSALAEDRVWAQRLLVATLQFQRNLKALEMTINDLFPPKGQFFPASEDQQSCNIKRRSDSMKGFARTAKKQCSFVKTHAVQTARVTLLFIPFPSSVSLIW